jgi:hypothetical protein
MCINTGDQEMHSVSKWMMTMALTVGSGSVMATTYDVSFNDGTEFIAGAIVTDSNTGLLSANDITSFNLSGRGPVNFQDDGSDGLACVIACQLTATATQLIFTPTGGGNEFIAFYTGGGVPFYNQMYLEGDDVVLVVPSPSLGGGPGYYFKDGYAGVIGTAITSVAAPEIDPSSAAGGLALLVGGLAVLRGRKLQNIVAATAMH